jgi:hypothetical protein
MRELRRMHIPQRVRRARHLRLLRMHQRHAASRDELSDAELHDPRPPVVLRLVGHVREEPEQLLITDRASAPVVYDLAERCRSPMPAVADENIR